MRKIMFLLLACAFIVSSSGFASTAESKPIKEGIQKVYYETGQLKSIESYKNGKLDGERKIYYESGQVRVECNYKNGEPVGIRKKYYQDGRIKQEITFKYDGGYDGWLDFDYKDYYPNGNIYEEGVVHGWKRFAEGKQFYKNGKLQGETIYENGKWISRYFYENGKLASETIHEKGRETHKGYDKDGKLKDPKDDDYYVDRVYPATWDRDE